MAIASNFPAIKPSLLLDFANTQKLDSRITFTRTTTATYYDGVTTAKAEQNLLLQSQTLNITWGVFACSVTADTDTAPDGTSTADSVTEDGTTTFHRITSNPVGLAASTVYTLSVFVKQKTGSRFATIGFNSDGLNYASATFDLSGGTNTQTLSAGYASVSATITASVNSWYRVTLTATTNAAATTSGLAVLGLSATSTFVSSSRGFDSYAGDSTSAILYWGAQLEQRSSVTAYTATTTQPITNYIPVLLTAASGVARFNHNPTTDESLGLLIEEARTNLALRSDDFANATWVKAASSITSNTIVAPDGTLTGDKLVENTTNANHTVRQPITVTSGTTYTSSCFIKAGERTECAVEIFTGATVYRAVFNLLTGAFISSTGTGSYNVSSVGNGWFRISITAAASTTTLNPFIYTSSGGTISYTGDGYSGIYIWGAQVEAGAFPTSYIATTSATVTRNADAASMTGTNFTSWYNAGQGTLYADINPMVLAAPNGVVINDNTTSNRIRLATTSVSDQGTVTVSGTAQATLDGGTPAANTNMKLAMTYQANNFALSLNGATAVTDTSGTVPVVSQLQIGSETTTVGNLQIKKIAYYPIASTATQLQALTS